MSKLKEDLKEDQKELKKQLNAVSKGRLILLACMLVVTVCSYVFYDLFFGDKSAWCRTPDTGYTLLDDVIKLIPIVVRCIQSITILLTLVTISILIVHKVGKKSQRGITVACLVRSLLNWLTAIIIIMIVLSNCGVDTTALITGAGVVTLVVGLGMQSLIADVVAGMFIVFENEFNVGDIVTIDGFRGEVVSIGIRSTKLKALGNYKIFHNNSIQGVLNQTIEPSVAKTLIDVEYGDRLPGVEKIIRDNVGNLQVPGAIGAVSYDGVAELGASGVTLQFTCQCNEADIFAVGRELNRAVKNMFDENGINIPFPQIVVHDAANQ